MWDLDSQEIVVALFFENTFYAQLEVNYHTHLTFCNNILNLKSSESR